MVAYPLSLPPYPAPIGAPPPPRLSEYTAWYAIAATGRVVTNRCMVCPGCTQVGVTRAVTAIFGFHGSLAGAGRGMRPAGAADDPPTVPVARSEEHTS